MSKVTKIKWTDIHSFQEEPGWCGPAVIHMILKSAGINKTQKEIADDVYKDWWGTAQQLMIAYLSRYFKDVNFSINTKITDIYEKLNDGQIVVVDWWDDLDSGDEDGHYSIIADYNSDILTMVDPSNARDGIWKMNIKDFVDRWYDTLDIHQKTWIDGWMLWLDPQQKY